MKNNSKKNKFPLSIGLFLWIFPLLHGQNSRWIDMLSYLKIKDIAATSSLIIGGSENAVFYYRPEDGSYDKYSTIQGISGATLDKIYYDENLQRLFVAHENGRIEVIKEDGSVYIETGLQQSALPPTEKKVNAVAADGGLLYLGMNFGISVYDLDDLHFGDTYHIGNGGSDLKINDLAVFGNKIYAATQGEGIKFIDLNNPYKQDFTQWQQTGAGNWKALRVFNGNLYGLKDNIIYLINPPASPVQMLSPGSGIKAVDANDRYFFIAFDQVIKQYNQGFQQLHTYQATSALPFRVTTIKALAEHLLIGSKKYGIIRKKLNTSDPFEIIHPNCPLMNIPFATDIYDGNIWVVYGDYDQLYNPYPLDYRGISHYIDGKWHNIPYSAFQRVTLTDVKIDRQDTSHVFIGSFHQGLLEFRNGELYQTYDNTNSTIEPIMLGNPPSPYPSYRISPLVWDKDHRLWMFQGLVMNGIHRFDPGQGNWTAYSFAPASGQADNEGAGDMEFDRDGNLWIATHRWGLVGFNPETGDMVALTENNNLPYEGSYRNTQAAAVDKDNTLWIGTLKGLRILPNPSRAFSDPQIQAEPVIIELQELNGQDNQGVELMSNQEITEIVVDGSNRKWIGTANAGLFYFSEDGQQTIYHFTEDNSPLPGNAIYDISIDPVKGTVLISTNRGLIGFKGDATEGRDNLDKAYVYPNPLNMKKDRQLVIRNIMRDINIKISDVEGNLVYETKSKGGTAVWDLKNFAGRYVASGVYLILLTDEDAQNTKVLKALIIR